jgi:hypothetical protein
MVGVVDFVDDLDVGPALELGDGVVADVIGPVIDIQYALFRGRRRGMPSAAGARAERNAGGGRNPKRAPIQRGATRGIVL